VVTFNQSSYEVIEYDESVTIAILLSQPSSVPFQVVINVTDLTTKSTYVSIRNLLMIIIVV